LFSEALDDIDKTIKLIVASLTDPAASRQEIKFCVAYKLSLCLLIEVKKCERETSTTATLGKIGLYTKFLADLPLQPKHRVVCMRMAINKNMESENFGISARLLEVVLV
jgi:hypothetical protein